MTECGYCGQRHPETTLPPCENNGCGRMDCVHNPDAPHTIENSSPTCDGYQSIDGVPFEGGGGQFGGGGATGGW